LQQAAHWVRCANVAEKVLDDAVLCFGQRVGQRLKELVQRRAIVRSVQRPAVLTAPLSLLLQQAQLQKEQLVEGQTPLCSLQRRYRIGKVNLHQRSGQAHQAGGMAYAVR
jgi:hypothetical protein